MVLSSRGGTDIAPRLSSPSQRHGAKGEPLTQLFWDAHAEAANTTKQLAASNSDPYDLSHVTFARVDYINVTEITSRWMIWKCVLLSLLPGILLLPVQRLTMLVLLLCPGLLISSLPTSEDRNSGS